MTKYSKFIVLLVHYNRCFWNVVYYADNSADTTLTIDIHAQLCIHWYDL